MQKLITLIILFALNISFAQSASEYWAGATSAYKAGNYAQAKEYYQQALSHLDNATLNYNLANTCEKLGEFGAAKAYYMRSIYQNPRFKEAIFNLENLEKNYALSSFNTSRSDMFFDELSHNEWLIMAVISLWIFLVLVVVLPLLKILKAWQFFLAFIFLALFTLSAFGVAYWIKFANTAVALVDNASLRLSPTEASGVAVSLKEGQMLTVKKENPNYALLQSASKKGWASLDGKSFIKIVD